MYGTAEDRTVMTRAQTMQLWTTYDTVVSTRANGSFGSKQKWATCTNEMKSLFFPKVTGDHAVKLPVITGYY